MYTRRKFLIHSASALALTLGTAQTSKAAVGPWTQLPTVEVVVNGQVKQELQGSRDSQTGLVWLDMILKTGNILSFSQAIQNSADYVSEDGSSTWRLPTLTEMKTAYSHGLPLSVNGVPNCPLYGTPGVHYLWWSSTTKANGKQASAIDLNTGISESVIVNNSYLYAIFVRQG